MAKPNQPKDIKPKEEGESPAKVKFQMNDNTKVIVINLITTFLICILFLSVTYILMSNLLDTKLAQKTSTEDLSASEEGDEGDSQEVQHGFILDLGDFILNLSDVSPRKYLKVNVALEVSNKPEDTVVAETSGSGHGGHGTEGVSSAISALETEMSKFKPAIRDAIITTLSSKTSAELSTVAGKELSKEQIAESVNGIFAGNREVIRVSFGDFIIQ